MYELVYNFGVWKGVWRMQREDRESKQKSGKLERTVGHPSSMQLLFPKGNEVFCVAVGDALSIWVGLQLDSQLLTYW